MKKNLCFIVLLFWAVTILAESMQYKCYFSCDARFIDYPSLDLEEPVIGPALKIDLYNLVEQFGIGGDIFYELSSQNSNIYDLHFYDVYLHSFSSFKDRKDYFIYGFWGGIRFIALELIDSESGILQKTKFNRPIFGFEFSSINWGTRIYWTQAENRKPILGYELKLRDNSGFIIYVGKTNRGKLTKIDSEIYLKLGYEIFD